MARAPRLLRQPPRIRQPRGYDEEEKEEEEEEIYLRSKEGISNTIKYSKARFAFG